MPKYKGTDIPKKNVNLAPAPKINICRKVTHPTARRVKIKTHKKRQATICVLSWISHLTLDTTIL